MVHGSQKGVAPAHVTPRWVKVLGVSALALVIIAGIAMVTGIGGTHGPWRHMSPSQTQGTAGQ
jgi:hypothetical protein